MYKSTQKFMTSIQNKITSDDIINSKYKNSNFKKNKEAIQFCLEKYPRSV
jgi:hypothetical protein